MLLGGKLCLCNSGCEKKLHHNTSSWMLFVLSGDVSSWWVKRGAHFWVSEKEQTLANMLFKGTFPVRRYKYKGLLLMHTEIFNELRHETSSNCVYLPVHLPHGPLTGTGTCQLIIDFFKKFLTMDQYWTYARKHTHTHMNKESGTHHRTCSPI